MSLKLKLKEEQKFLFETMAPYKRCCFLFLGGSLLASIFDGISIGLLVPLLSYLQGDQAGETLSGPFKPLAQFLAARPLEEQLLISLSFVVFAVVMKNVFVGFAYKQGVWLSNRITADLRMRVMDLLLSVGLEFHHQSKLGELIEKAVNNTQKMRELIIYSVQFVVFFLTLLALIALLFVFSWQLSLVSLALGGLGAFVMGRYMKVLSQLGLVLTQRNREMTHAVQENLSAIQVIQSFGQEEAQLTKLKAKIEQNCDSENALAFRSLWIQPLTETVGIVAISVLLVICFVFLPVENKVIFAQVLPFLYVLVRIVPTLKILNDAKGIIQGQWPTLSIVYELLRRDNKPILPEGETELAYFKEEIRFESVSFAYDRSGPDVLKNVSFAFPKGKTTAIMGRSGAGKSSIVNLLLRFYDPQQGGIFIDGQALSSLKLASYRRKISVVSQDTFLFNESVHHNITFGAHGVISEAQVIEAAKVAGAHDFIMALSAGYQTMLGDRGMMLSGGQRQRISIARALLKDPEILILDEATSALDQVTERAVHQAIVSLSHNRTVIIIAHRLATLQNADQVIVLENGAVRDIGDVERMTTLYEAEQ